jgi:hypothetical protein
MENSKVHREEKKDGEKKDRDGEKWRERERERGESILGWYH